MNSYEKAIETKKKEMTKDYISSYKGGRSKTIDSRESRGFGKKKAPQSHMGNKVYQQINNRTK